MSFDSLRSLRMTRGDSGRRAFARDDKGVMVMGTGKDRSGLSKNGKAQLWSWAARLDGNPATKNSIARAVKSDGRVTAVEKGGWAHVFDLAGRFGEGGGSAVHQAGIEPGRAQLAADEVGAGLAGAAAEGGEIEAGEFLEEHPARGDQGSVAAAGANMMITGALAAHGEPVGIVELLDSVPSGDNDSRDAAALGWREPEFILPLGPARHKPFVTLTTPGRGALEGKATALPLSFSCAI